MIKMDMLHMDLLNTKAWNGVLKEELDKTYLDADEKQFIIAATKQKLNRHLSKRR